MRPLRLAWLCLLPVPGVVATGCSSPNASPGTGNLRITTETREGAPCGDWDDGATHMIVQCAAGLSCQTAGTLTHGSQIAMCVRHELTACSQCADGRHCGDFHGTGVCLMQCQTSADCVGPFEVCSSFGCNFQDCSVDGTCPPDSHCNGQICERGPPG